MILLASDWLALAILMCVFAYMAGRRWVAFSLPVAVALAALAVYLPTGSPRFTAPPPGKYTVLGADIQVNVAIYALLKPETGAAVYYKLPYSTSAANDLQQALDGAQNGQGVKTTIDGEGGQTYDGDPPVTGDAPKVPEVPSVTLP